MAISAILYMIEHDNKIPDENMERTEPKSDSIADRGNFSKRELRMITWHSLPYWCKPL